MATLTGLLSRLTSASGSLLMPTSVTELAVREASKKAGSSTRNKCRNTPGKRRGIKIYDGQRIPSGKMLVKQHRLQVLPGWNTKMLHTCDIVALSHGRAILTTEKIDPKMEAYQRLPPRLGAVLAPHMLNENIYKVHVHVIPDEQHQYFKLVDQV